MLAKLLTYLSAARLHADARVMQLRLAHSAVVLQVDLEVALVGIPIVSVTAVGGAKSTHSKYSRSRHVFQAGGSG